MSKSTLILIFLSAAAMAYLYRDFRTEERTFFAQAEPTVDDRFRTKVSDAELDRYIDVYESMQQDRQLKIDAAIVPFEISLDDFRELERRVQMDSALVGRVRDALLDNAKRNAKFARPAGR